MARNQCQPPRPYDPTFQSVSCTATGNCCSIYGMCGVQGEPHCGAAFDSANPSLSTYNPITGAGAPTSETSPGTNPEVGAETSTTTSSSASYVISVCSYICCLILLLMIIFGIIFYM